VVWLSGTWPDLSFPRKSLSDEMVLHHLIKKYAKIILLAFSFRD
jgi:hypothetical protein